METVRVLTFQTPDVLEQILNTGVYYPSPKLSRERRDYKLDIEQLDGYHPVWCFTPIGITSRFVPLKIKDKFSFEDFLNGSLFFTYKCEMSFHSAERFNDLVLLELEVPLNVPKVGKTHNSYKGAVVIPYVCKEDLVAVYKLKYDDNDRVNQKGFYPDVTVERVFKEDPLFKDNFSCKGND